MKTFALVFGVSLVLIGITHWLTSFGDLYLEHRRFQRIYGPVVFLAGLGLLWWGLIR